MVSMVLVARFSVAPPASPYRQGSRCSQAAKAQGCAWRCIGIAMCRAVHTGSGELCARGDGAGCPCWTGNQPVASGPSGADAPGDRLEGRATARRERLETRNRLLLRLPQADRAAILANAERVPLAIGDVLVDETIPLTHAYFPDSGLASFVAVMEDGSMVEAASVGRDGFVGMILLHRSAHSRTRVVWQVPGAAWAIPAETFVDLAEEGRFGRTLDLFQQELLEQMAQVAGCNRRHTIVQRAARWLLMTHDRVEGDEFELTQEFLATMLGAERPKVTLAAQRLRSAGLIWYRRSIIRVLDRPGLEAASCDCYRVIAAAYPGSARD
jgi:CRP-like cAMP-binding protein